MDQIFAHLAALSTIVFGVPPDDAYKVSQQNLGQAAQYEQKYIYDADQDAMVDQATGAVVQNVDGVFTAPDGTELAPGFAVTRGPATTSNCLPTPACVRCS